MTTVVKFKNWETAIHKPFNRLYFIWRYLVATSDPEEMKKIPEKFQAIMQKFRGGSRVLHLRIYLRYRVHPKQQWDGDDSYFQQEWENAVKFASRATEAGSVLSPERADEGGVQLNRNWSRRLKTLGSRKAF